MAVLGVGAAGIAPAGAIAPPAPIGCTTGLITHLDITPTAIADVATTTDTINVAGRTGTIWDVDAFTNITHTFPGDLDITVQSPAGTVVTLTSDNGGTNDNIYGGTVWDDSAQDPVTDHVFTNLVVEPDLSPEEPLSAFIGEDPNGVWTITIRDDTAVDTGTLNSWTLAITTLEGPLFQVPTVAFNNTDVAIPDAGTTQLTVIGPPTTEFLTKVRVQTNIGHAFPADLDMTLTSPNGTEVTLTTDNAGTNDNVFAGQIWDDDADPGSQVPYVVNPQIVTDHIYSNNVAAGPLTPEEPLAAFRGELGSGTWTLTIRDDTALDIGTIFDFGLELTSATCMPPQDPPAPAPLPEPEPPVVPPTLHEVEVVAGADRVGTAIKVSQASFPNGSADAVVLARRDDFPDALAGTPLAAAKGGPMLLTSPSTLENDVADEIDRVLGGGGDVYLLGGTGALSPAVASALTSSGYTVHRLAGENRYETAVAIAGALGNPQTVLEASGLNFPDAVSAGAAAIQENAAVLLTNGSSQSAATAGYLAANPGATRFAIGGPARSADPDALEIVGENRFETSAMVATRFFPSPTVAGVASGRNFPDALTGGVQVGVLGGPMLLTEPGDLPAPVTDFLDANFSSISKVFVYGGPDAVGAPVLSEIQEAIS